MTLSNSIKKCKSQVWNSGLSESRDQVFTYHTASCNPVSWNPNWDLNLKFKLMSLYRDEWIDGLMDGWMVDG